MSCAIQQLFMQEKNWSDNVIIKVFTKIGNFYEWESPTQSSVAFAFTSWQTKSQHIGVWRFDLAFAWIGLVKAKATKLFYSYGFKHLLPSKSFYFKQKLLLDTFYFLAKAWFYSYGPIPMEREKSRKDFKSKWLKFNFLSREVMGFWKTRNFSRLTYSPFQWKKNLGRLSGIVYYCYHTISQILWFNLYKSTIYRG